MSINNIWQFTPKLYTNVIYKRGNRGRNFFSNNGNEMSLKRNNRTTDRIRI